jgi:transposase
MSDTELLLEPNAQPEPVRRLEVFTGAGRRRRWTSEEKAGIVSETFETGASVSAVARRHGLTPQQLFAWRRAWRDRLESAAGASSAAFAPVVVDAARPCAAAPIAPTHPLIEIVIGAATVRIAPGIDVATLQTVLRAVRAAT